MTTRPATRAEAIHRAVDAASWARRYRDSGDTMRADLWGRLAELWARLAENLTKQSTQEGPPE